ncbi:LOW QUALITY PROTEIN: Serine/threonine-protein kinase Nek4 [Plecturocebus cupreus]
MGPAEPVRPYTPQWEAPHRAPAKQLRQPKESRWRPVCLLCRESPDVTPLSRLECSGTVVARCSIKLLGSSDLPTSASREAAIIGACHHTLLTSIFFCRGFAMLLRLVSSSLAQAVPLPQPPKALGLQIPGDSQQRSHTGRQRDSFGRRGCFAGARRGTSQCGVYGTDRLGWSHPHKENSNWKR